jgi:TPR repeat protein
MAPRLFISVALVAWFCLCGGHARADFQRAVSAYEAGNFEAAADELSQEAAAGDPRAQAFLGYLLLRGSSSKADLRRGLDLLRSAADAGDPEAQFTLGVACLHGVRSGDTVILEKSEFRALEYFERAATEGIAAAHIFVGALLRDVHDRGIGLSRVAVDKLTKARDGGFLVARGALIINEVQTGSALTDLQKLDLLLKYQSDGYAQEVYLLGIFYEEGRGTAVNLVEALKWFVLADYLGDDDAAEKVNSLSSKLSEPERRFARESADRWLMDTAHSPTGLYPIAARWCLDAEPGSLQCLKQAASDYPGCSPPYFPPFSENYYRSKAYDICRRDLLDHPKERYK